MADISIAAVGDISFAGSGFATPSVALFENVRSLLQAAGLTVANLECVLAEDGDQVRGKAVLRGAPGWAGVLKQAGIDAVSLANNHVMDFGAEGLGCTIQALDSAGVRHAGAGSNKEEACAPLWITAGKMKIALLARTSVIVSSPCYATGSDPGVARLDEREAVAAVRACREDADLVLLFLHWGVEHHSCPSPEQRRIARSLASAGADLVIGHHPHVLQGIERIENCRVAYSLGNFVMDDFSWKMRDSEGRDRMRHVRLSPENRLGGILTASLEGNRIRSVEFIPTLCRPGGGVELCNDSECLRRTGRLSRRLGYPGYGLLWRFYAAWMEWRLRWRPRMPGWRRLMKLRPRHLLELAQLARRSARVASGRTTNPYE